MSVAVAGLSDVCGALHNEGEVGDADGDVDLDEDGSVDVADVRDGGVGGALWTMLLVMAMRLMVTSESLGSTAT